MSRAWPAWFGFVDRALRFGLHPTATPAARPSEDARASPIEDTSMNLNIGADIAAFETWLAGLSPQAPAQSVAPPLSAAKDSIASAEAALEQAVDAAAEALADELISKLPGGAIALKLGGAVLNSTIVKLVDKGAHAIPGWSAPSIGAPPPPASPASPPPVEAGFAVPPAA